MGASRASNRLAARAGARWRPDPLRAPERHLPEQTTLHRLVQQHAASFIAHTEASTGAELPRFIKDEFDAFLECGHDQVLAFSCKRCGFCPSCGARRMSQTAAHLVDHVIPHVPVRQWVLSLPIRAAGQVELQLKTKFQWRLTCSQAKS